MTKEKNIMKISCECLIFFKTDYRLFKEGRRLICNHEFAYLMKRHFLHLFRLLESIVHLIYVELQQSVTHVQKHLKEEELKIEELIIKNNMPS